MIFQIPQYSDSIHLGWDTQGDDDALVLHARRVHELLQSMAPFAERSWDTLIKGVEISLRTTSKCGICLTKHSSAHQNVGRTHVFVRNWYHSQSKVAFQRYPTHALSDSSTSCILCGSGDDLNRKACVSSTFWCALVRFVETKQQFLHQILPLSATTRLRLRAFCGSIHLGRCTMVMNGDVWLVHGQSQIAHSFGPDDFYHSLYFLA